MNYDDWKLMTPEEDADFRYGRRRFECDVCGARVARLHCVIAYGIETYACDGCTGCDPEDD